VEILRSAQTDTDGQFLSTCQGSGVLGVHDLLELDAIAEDPFTAGGDG
jgi:hypothetical protein